MQGSTIGQYRVTALIGQGGMGEVYAAEHTLLGRPAAIKVLHPEMSQKQDVVMRFFNEARAATAIRHPGIVEIYDFGWTPEGAAFIVMEHLQGETLASRSERVQMQWQTALAIARQIAGALGAAHAKGIVHRDLKPDNIFLVPDPEVPGGERIKLLDFGIAKLAGDATATANVTRTGAVMGTPTYMAPEQCRGVAVDHRADLYALGCIAFELCCGRPPFVGEGSGDVLAAHIHVPVPTMGSLGAELPAAVEALVQQLLVKNPAQRIQTAEALIRAIDTVAPDRTHSTTGAQLEGRPRVATAGSLPMARSGSAPATPVAAAASGMSSGASSSMSSMSSGISSGVSGPSDVTTLSGAASTKTRMPAAGSRRRIAIIAATLAVAGIVGVVLATRGGGGAGDDGGAAKIAASQAQPQPADPATQPSATGSAETPKPAGAPNGSAETPKTAGAPASAAGAPNGSAETPKATGSVNGAAGTATPMPAPARPAPAPPATPPAAVDLDIDSVPAGASVLLGGVALGKTPLHTTVTRTSDAALVVRLAGYADRSVTFHAGRSLTEHLSLVKVAPKRPARTNRDQSVNPFGD
ncbi:MAG TPA: serine/threonine-protein kinase [Kofleriaceae bacterium]|jgi:serine/threonine-protein kinase|nr:serine/threonine-protein kinase [Kofleriaceae bacterium]